MFYSTHAYPKVFCSVTFVPRTEFIEPQINLFLYFLSLRFEFSFRTTTTLFLLTRFTNSVLLFRVRIKVPTHRTKTINLMFVVGIRTG